MSQTIESCEASFNPKEQRKALFSYLTRIVRLSHEKLNVRTSTDRVKQGWARVMISAIATYGDLLDGVQFDELEDRILILEGVKRKIE